MRNYDLIILLSVRA